MFFWLFHICFPFSYWKRKLHIHSTSFITFLMTSNFLLILSLVRNVVLFFLLLLLFFLRFTDHVIWLFHTWNMASLSLNLELSFYLYSGFYFWVLIISSHSFFVSFYSYFKKPLNSLKPFFPKPCILLTVWTDCPDDLLQSLNSETYIHYSQQLEPLLCGVCLYSFSSLVYSLGLIA